MKNKRREAGLHPALWTVVLIVALVGGTFLTRAMFTRSFRSYAEVTLVSERTGLVMESGAKVKFRGVQVGRVAAIQSSDPVRLELQLYSDQLKFIPANVGAQITAPTAFGAKYVDLLAPSNPSPQRLTARATVASGNVSTEVNTVFQNLIEVLDKIDPAKLNAVVSSLAEGLRGKGEALGESITDFNQVLLALNPRSEEIRADYRALKGFADTYSAAAANIVNVLDAASTTSATVVTDAPELDSLLLKVTGLSRTGVDLLGPNRDDLIAGVNLLEPTTRLLMKYNPAITCTILGADHLFEMGWGDAVGGRNGYSVILDAGLLFGDDQYRYPENLPINGAKGGYGGQPSCGPLPYAEKNWPVPYLVTNTGWGTGVDMRPNAGIGFPGWESYLPATRGYPEPPIINYTGGPAPGPWNLPPYGAPLYGPDGAPLYPGLPPAPPPGSPQEPGPPPPGAEPYSPPHPAEMPATDWGRPPPPPVP